MPKPPGGPQTPTHPPPSALNCWLWSVVTVESICFFGVLQDLNYVLPPTRFKPLWAVRFVTKFTSETFNRRVEKQPRYPCGLCGLRGALGGDPKTAHDEASSGCYMWVDQSGKKAMHECKLLGSVSYNLSTSSKCALSMPCTNTPFKCKMPGCNMYVWTYNMKTHYADNHQGAEMSEDVKNQVLLKSHERTYVNQLVVAYTKGDKTVCPILMIAMKNKEATCTCVIRNRMFWE